MKGTPANPVSSSTDSWTRVTNDNAGRTTEVATFGGATKPASSGTSGTWTGSVTTAYDANFTTVTDQAGKVRRSKVDALGRLVRVDEPDVNNSLGTTSSPAQPTSYAYYVLGNLLTVTQGSQTRTFTYDSLSRLRSALNPESGTITYTYDNNGNLTQKTDARGVVTSYGYDALNRNTAISYSDGVTMGISRVYDQTTNGKGRLSWEWQCLDATHCAVTESFNYDALGRVVNRNQAFWVNGAWGANFGVYASYDLAGNLKTETYPSNHTVTYNYDAAGRLADKVPGSQTASELAFSGNLGDGVTRTYAKGTSYDAASRMTRELFGTDTPLYHNWHYNARGQLYDTRVGSGTDGNGAEWTWNRGALQMYYEPSYTLGASGVNNNGNILMTAQHLPNNDPASSEVVNYQQYSYDSLNRLTSVLETSQPSPGTWTTPYKQSYLYDRWGNRTIDPANTWGPVNAQQFSVTVLKQTKPGSGLRSLRFSHAFSGLPLATAITTNSKSRVLGGLF